MIVEAYTEVTWVAPYLQPLIFPGAQGTIVFHEGRYYVQLLDGLPFLPQDVHGWDAPLLSALNRISRSIVNQASLIETDTPFEIHLPEITLIVQPVGQAP